MKTIHPGDYFLRPFSGKRRDLLVQAESELIGLGQGQWRVKDAHGETSICLLTSCHRCPPSVAKRILKYP